CTVSIYPRVVPSSLSRPPGSKLSIPIFLAERRCWESVVLCRRRVSFDSSAILLAIISKLHSPRADERCNVFAKCGHNSKPFVSLRLTARASRRVGRMASNLGERFVVSSSHYHLRCSC